MKDDEIERWITLENGQHVPLGKGESKREAVNKFLNKKLSRVEKNKDKYDKINEFKRKKQTNKLNKKNNEKQDDDEEYGKKVIRLERRGSQYIPIREGEEKKFKETLDNDREEFYEKFAKYYSNKDDEYYAIVDNEMKKELKEKLDPKFKEQGSVTKEDVKEVIENFKKRKQSNNLKKPTFSGTQEEKLKQEKDYLEKQITDLEAGNTFSVRDNPANKQNYLMSIKNYMSPEDRRKYEELKNRRDDILRELYKNRNTK